MTERLAAVIVRLDPEAPVTGVTVDLDDTLYPQAAWLDGAWRAVAATGGRHGVDPVRLLAALRSVAAEGSDRGRIIDRSLALVGGAGLPVAPLAAAFAQHAPEHLDCYPGVREALGRLRAQVPVVVVTDGAPAGQRAKLRALGLEGAVDAVVISDEIGGRRARKPDPRPFRAALRALDAEPGQAVHVGDRPAKDVIGAAAAGMRAVRVRTGEYAGVPDDPAHPAWRTVDSFVAAVDAVLATVAPVAVRI